MEAAQLPPLRPLDPKQIFCLEKCRLVLPTEGAPLVYSTSIAHDFVLHVEDKAGAQMDLPAKAEAERGGFLIDAHALRGGKARAGGFYEKVARAVGVEAFDGPRFLLRSAHSEKWTIPSTEQEALIVGAKTCCT